MLSKTLMVVGTMSSVGKSFLVTGLCRIFAKKGVKVAPFKAQNMSNNAAVCKNGGEIARAQYLQALACKTEPLVEMNPVLLKPEKDSRSQIVVLGKVWNSLEAKNYYQKKQELWNVVRDSLDFLRKRYDLIIIEGAGSPVELNLKQNDIVNMAVAKYVNAPTLLVGDIDRGGIFAQLLGTYWLLEEDERKLVKGFVVNKFRGDIELFKDGITILENRSKVPVLGVIPYLKDLLLPEEDGAIIDEIAKNSEFKKDQIDICVIAYPHISNFDDFDALKMESGVKVRFIRSIENFKNPDVVVLPGTKSTILDLLWMRQTGFDKLVLDYASSGGKVVGICGGYQMLGKKIYDELHTESDIDQVDGLGLLDTVTHFKKQKSTFQIKAKVLNSELELKVEEILIGYEIHSGITEVLNGSYLFQIIQRNLEPVFILDGTMNQKGNVWGTYIHGIFNNDAFRRNWLKTLGWKHSSEIEYEKTIENSIEKLADVIQKSIDMDKLIKMIQ